MNAEFVHGHSAWRLLRSGLKHMAQPLSSGFRSMCPKRSMQWSRDWVPNSFDIYLRQCRNCLCWWLFGYEMNAPALGPQCRVVNVNHLIPISLRIHQCVAERASLDKTNVDVTRANFSRAIAQAMEPVK